MLSFQLSVTDIPCLWKNAPAITQDLYKRIREIDFGKKIKKCYPAIQKIQENDLRHIELLKAIQKDGINCAAMAVFCDKQTYEFCCDSCTRAKELEEKFESFDLSKLYHPNNRLKPLEELRSLSDHICSNMDNNPDTIKDIEIGTALQNSSQWWMKLRRGRITASLLKDVCRSNLLKPSISLIKKICSSESATLSTPAVKYGREFEDRAVHKLFELVGETHTNLVLRKSGLHLSQENPYLGASPDAVFDCTCHGTVTVEVKCPYSAKDATNMRDILLKLKDPYIELDANGNVIMNVHHKYYYQTLMQVHICEAAFGYFFIWSGHDCLIFQVKRDNVFWNYCKDRANTFYKNVIVPELLAHYYTDMTTN